MTRTRLSKTRSDGGQLVGNVADRVAKSDVADALEIGHVFVGVMLHELRDGCEVFVLEEVRVRHPTDVEMLDTSLVPAMQRK